MFVTAQLPQAVAPLADVAPILRGACEPQGRQDRRRVAAAHPRFPRDARHPQFRQRRRARALQPGRRGHARPHHPHQELAADRARARRRQARRLQAAPRARRSRHSSRTTRPISRATTRASAASRSMLDPLPRVVLVPGLGLFGLGRSKKDARVAADLAECRDRDHHRRRGDRPVRVDLRSRHVRHGILVARTGQARRGQGNAARRPDRRRSPAPPAPSAPRPRRPSPPPAPRWRCSISTKPARRQRPKAIGGAALAVRCDVTDAASVSAAFDKIAETFGGVDIVVSNAGAAWQGRIGEVDEATLRKSFELNFYGHQRVAQAAVKIMLAQGTGGCLLFNVSKQAVNPGPNFGPYGLPKAATLFLVRQYARRLRRRRHSRQCGQCRPHPLGLAHRRIHRRALEGARRHREGLHERQSARAARSPPTTSRRRSWRRRWRSRPPPTSPPSTAAISRRRCGRPVRSG